MTDIDELSRTLGAIQADIQHIKKGTDAIEEKVDKAHDNVIEVKISTKSAHKRIDSIHANIIPHVEDYKKMKQRGIGIIAVLGTIFGFIGALILKSFHHLIG